MNRHFNVAPWPTALKLVSAIGAIVLIGVTYFAYRVIPVPFGFTHNFGLAVALVPFLLLVGCLVSIVSGYSVDLARLSIHRLVTSTVIPLAGLRRAWADPAACKGSLRVFGNGGLFSFTGRFYSKRLGHYRAYVTDFRKAVVLQFADRVVVISPAVPQAFLDHVQRLLPSVKIGAEDGR